MKEIWKRMLSFVAALTLCIGLISAVSASESEPFDDGAAFGPMQMAQLDADTKLAWTNDAMDQEKFKTLINSQTLYPQKTGWKELDDLIASIISGAENDPYSQLYAAYSYLVKNVEYSWEHYTYTTASVASYNSFDYNYLRDLTYEDGLQKSIPDDMANRAYHILKYNRGVCYDYAIAIAVVARYIGIESYVHTGRFIFEDTSLGAGHHGWAVLTIGGTNYVVDPQRDARNWQYYGRIGYYFGIPAGSAHRYQPAYWQQDINANPQRDASMLPVTAERTHKVTAYARATNGTVTGQGDYITGNSVTLTAKANDGYRFVGWYDERERCVSTSASYTFTVKDTVTLTAKFQQDSHVVDCPTKDYKDVPRDAWYHDAVDYVTAEAIIQGKDDKFDPDGVTTRAVMVQALYKMAGTPMPCFDTDEEQIRKYVYAADNADGVPEEVKEQFVSWFMEGEGWTWWKYGKTSGEKAWYFTRNKDGNIRLNLRDYSREDPAETNFAYHLSSLDWDGTQVTQTRNSQLVYKDQVPTNYFVTIFTPDPNEDWNVYYSDVTDKMDGSWAIRWATQQGIVNGYEDSTFRPDQLVSRQELATILYRTAKVLGRDLSGGISLEKFPDGDQVGSWATDAVRWACGKGYINGSDENGQILLLPEDGATRAQMAAILMRFEGVTATSQVTAAAPQTVQELEPNIEADSEDLDGN